MSAVVYSLYVLSVMTENQIPALRDMDTKPRYSFGLEAKVRPPPDVFPRRLSPQSLGVQNIDG